MNISRVGMWESNGTVPRQDVLVKLANYFCVTIDSLLNEEGDLKMSENKKINSIQRGLKKLSSVELNTAENVLKSVFKEAFEE